MRSILRHILVVLLVIAFKTKSEYPSGKKENSWMVAQDPMMLMRRAYYEASGSTRRYIPGENRMEEDEEREERRNSAMGVEIDHSINRGAGRRFWRLILAFNIVEPSDPWIERPPCHFLTLLRGVESRRYYWWSMQQRYRLNL